MHSVANVNKRLNLPQGSLRKLVPVLKMLPGIYSMDETPRKKRMYIIAEQRLWRLHHLIFPENQENLPVLLGVKRYPFCDSWRVPLCHI